MAAPLVPVPPVARVEPAVPPAALAGEKSKILAPLPSLPEEAKPSKPAADPTPASLPPKVEKVESAGAAEIKPPPIPVKADLPPAKPEAQAGKAESAAELGSTPSELPWMAEKSKAKKGLFERLSAWVSSRKTSPPAAAQKSSQRPVAKPFKEEAPSAGTAQEGKPVQAAALPELPPLPPRAETPAPAGEKPVVPPARSITKAVYDPEREATRGKTSFLRNYQVKSPAGQDVKPSAPEPVKSIAAESKAAEAPAIPPPPAAPQVEVPKPPPLAVKVSPPPPLPPKIEAPQALQPEIPSPPSVAPLPSLPASMLPTRPIETPAPEPLAKLPPPLVPPVSAPAAPPEIPSVPAAPVLPSLPPIPEVPTAEPAPLSLRVTRPMGLKKPLEKKHLRALRGVKDKQKLAQTQEVRPVLTPPPLKTPIRPAEAPTSIMPDVPSVKPYPLPQPPSQPGIPQPPPVMVTPAEPVPPAKPPRIAGPLAKTTMLGKVPTDLVPLPPKAEAPAVPVPAPQAPVPPPPPLQPVPVAKIEAAKVEAPVVLPPIAEPTPPKPAPVAKIEAAKAEAPAVLPPIAEPLSPKSAPPAEIPAQPETKETKPEAVSSAPSAPEAREARKVRLLKRKATAAALLTTSERPRRSFSIPVPVRIAAVVLFLAALGTGLYYYLRETQVRAVVQSGDYVLSRDLLVVSDFSGRLNMLQRDFDRRREPLLREIRTEEGYLSASQAEWNGKKTKLKLLLDESARMKASIPEVIKENQKALDRLWNEKSAGLEKEFEAKRTALMDEIKAKAAALKLEKFNPNLEIPAVEVAVNAFRLALYSAPAGTKVDEERKWVEGLLNSWRDYEEDWREEQIAIRDEALKLKQAPGPKIEEINDRIASLQVEIDSLRIETSSLEAEVKRFEERLAGKKGELAAVEPPFYAELLAVPGEFTRMTLPLQGDGSLVLRDMDKDPRFAAEIPGKLTLMARATKDGEEFWALKEVELNQYKKNAWKIAPGDFYPARKHLKISP